MANIKAQKNQRVNITPGRNALAKVLRDTGRLPPVSIRVKPLDSRRKEFFTDRFLSYSFKSSILIPVDSFTFKTKIDPKIAPTRPIRSGDIVTLYANDIKIATGIIDSTDVETDANSGTTITFTGRDLLSQLEDNDSVNTDSEIIYGNQYTVDAIMGRLLANTKISPTLIKRYAPGLAYLFATQPGETKLASLQRYCEGLNILFWSSPDGQIIIGKPNMYARAIGNLALKSVARSANVLTMRSTRNPTATPNIIMPIWNGQETVQARISKEQILLNNDVDASELRKYGHKVIKSVVVSTPDGASPQDLSEVNTLTVAGQETKDLNKAGASNILQSHAKREIARGNMNTLKVEVQMYGHFNDLANPFLTDTAYHIIYEPDGIDEEMYLYEVDYVFDEQRSQMTSLFFCRRNAIVSDVRAV